MVDLQYDPISGLVSTMALPGGETIEVSYETGGRVQQVARDTGVIATSSIVSYGYDGPGVLSTTWTGPYVNGTVAYDLSGSYTEVADRQIAQTVTASTSYPATVYVYDDDEDLISAGAMQVLREPGTGATDQRVLGSFSDDRSYDLFGALAFYSAFYGTTELYAVSLTPDALGRIASKTETVEGTV